MKKCASCGYENEDSSRYCENCGASEFVCEKRCPQCHSVVKPDTQICNDCGAYLGGGGSPSASDKLGGMAIGDKNVFAGDVVGKQENMKFFGNATIVKNDDETKKTVQCHVCGRHIIILDSVTCLVCQEKTCKNCFDEAHKSCKSCVEKKNAQQEELYVNAFRKAFEDGIITIEESQQLKALQKQLGISVARAFELERQIKDGARKGKASSTLSSFVRISLEQALDLLYNDGKAEKAYESLLPIYKRYPENEEVLTGFIAAAIKVNPDEALNIIRHNQADLVGLHLANIDYDLMNGDLDSVDEKLNVVDSLWPDNLLVMCRKIMCYMAMYEKLQAGTFLKIAAECLSVLPPPQNKLEASWACRVQYVVRSAMGENVPKVTRSYCKEHDLYFVVAHGEGEDADEMFERALALQKDDPHLYLEIITKLAADGHADAQYKLGDCYNLGNVVDEDDATAVKWYRKAAEQGHADAQYNLANCYYIGLGVKKDRAAAVELYRKAAEQGHMDAQFTLADCYSWGEGIDKDAAAAENWYRKAAEHGCHLAQSTLKALLDA